MSVQFDEDNFVPKSMYTPPSVTQAQPVKTGSKFGNWLVRAGLATSASSANAIMLVLAALVFGVSAYFFFFGFAFPSFSDTSTDSQRLSQPIPR